MGFMSIGSTLTTTLCLIASSISVLNIKDRGLACQENISPLISDRILLFRDVLPNTKSMAVLMSMLYFKYKATDWMIGRYN
jgi:hypothetical protein